MIFDFADGGYFYRGAGEEGFVGCGEIFQLKIARFYWDAIVVS